MHRHLTTEVVGVVHRACMRPAQFQYGIGAVGAHAKIGVPSSRSVPENVRSSCSPTTRTIRVVRYVARNVTPSTMMSAMMKQTREEMVTITQLISTHPPYGQVGFYGRLVYS